ncbi:NUDIX hydrolase [Serpentinicella alkaliphila]|uniref:ADP-ribose pyrophosphatase YjhB (NUDIX family) n=1 Tax=Serpentinicella alkaliphila TaxID=1734049 RepID=A0A4R2SXL6_9FIRM|nr:NUDIX hydrolase [Serpentinicella alkaliphila]QUH26434.1 NUDIX hydrolase [Serpentinicella alkaliphila]TCP95269.1 ADP-ribose pyrophosphatase YjhB (NUDIX family) [Serpentinicella alkaliphila]
MNWIETINNYIACNEQEEKDKELTLKCIDMFEDLLTRENKLVHLTSSAIVVNKSKDKVLMVYHNIYDSWSWAGGHTDGEEDLLFVAIKEVKEETGIKNVFPVRQDIISLDIIPVLGHTKKEEYISPHLHISVAYLLEADECEPLAVKIDENSGVKWIPMKEIDIYSSEPHMKKIYSKCLNKIL